MALSMQVHESHELGTRTNPLIFKDKPYELCINCKYCRCHYIDILVRPCTKAKEAK